MFLSKKHISIPSLFWIVISMGVGIGQIITRVVTDEKKDVDDDDDDDDDEDGPPAVQWWAEARRRGGGFECTSLEWRISLVIKLENNLHLCSYHRIDVE